MSAPKQHDVPDAKGKYTHYIVFSISRFVFSRLRLYLYNRNIKTIIIMETKQTRKTTGRKKKLTPDERRALIDAIVPQNKSMKAVLEHQGEVWVNDPMLLI